MSKRKIMHKFLDSIFDSAIRTEIKTREAFSEENLQAKKKSFENSYIGGKITRALSEVAKYKYVKAIKAFIKHVASFFNKNKDGK